MVAAYHLLWTIYGYWLPNDPRGSTSRLFRSDVIRELGELHYGRKQIQPASKDLRAFFDRARQVLKHAVIEFSNPEINMLAGDFADVIAKHRYTCYACAIMPDHVHLLIRKHKHSAEQMIVNFQASSQLLCMKKRLRPGDHPVWGGPGWKVFLGTQEEIERTIRYIEQNPIKARLAPQRWPFVKKYDGWLPGGADAPVRKKNAKPPSERASRLPAGHRGACRALARRFRACWAKRSFAGLPRWQSRALPRAVVTSQAHFSFALAAIPLYHQAKP